MGPFATAIFRGHMRQPITTTSLVVTSLAVLVFTVAAKEPSPQQAKSKAYGNADAITQEELKVYDYFLASDQLEGRYFPSRGYDAAALYVASHLAEWGVKPGGSTSGTNGPLQPYFMPIELVSTQLVPAETKASLTAPAPPPGGGRGGGGRGAAGAPAVPRTTDFEYGKDWTTGGGGGRGAAPAAADLTGPLVFAGHGYVIPKSNTNPYQGLDVKGKIIVVAGLPPELTAQPAAAGAGGRAGAAGGGGRGGNPLGTDGTDFFSPGKYALANGALAVVTVPTFQQLTAMAAANAGGGRGVGLNGPPYQVVKFQNAQPSVPAITAGLDMTNAIFQGEKMSGAQIFNGAVANAKLDSFELNAEKKLAVHLSVHSEPGHGENVIGMIEGSDPVLKNEYVVMSAHLDHIGLTTPQNGDGINNGADDDGSGSTGLLGIAHAYADGAAKGMRPKRTIIFLWNAGEERGLWGSQYFAQFPPIDITKVVVCLNMDMIGRTKTPGYVDPPSYKLVEPNETFVVGPNISSDELERTLETVNNSFQKMTLNHFYDVTAPDATHDNLGPTATGQRIFYRSDHYNFAKMGIPIAFFSDGLHVDYHRVTDSPEKIDYHEIQAVSKTVAALGWVIGNEAAGATPKLNAKLPEQLINDMNLVKAQGWGKLTPVLPPLPGMPF
jgi:Zn-dependent M28 family amino/carboxypeptidase